MPALGDARHVRRTVDVMGTVFSVDLVDDTGQAQRALDDIESWWHWVDATFSTYRENSVVTRISAGDLTVREAPPEVAEVLALCAQMQRRTGGYFNAVNGKAIDPTGLVKGWSVEVASDRLHAAGLTRHCINGGGDIQARGTPTDDRLWAVAVAHPLRPAEVLTVVHGEDVAVATSGVAERGAHIIDPFTGRPATELASVTIVGPHVTVADGYATAAMAMGRAARPWLEQVAAEEDYHAMVVDAAGDVTCTSGWGRLASPPAAASSSHQAHRQETQ